MSRPLVSKRTSVSTAKTKRHALVTSHEFHRRVFAAHGNRCYWCGLPASDAAHIISRWQLGPHRYSCPEINGRPACRPCHDLNTVHALHFAAKDVRRAVSALNKVLTVKVRMPA